MTLIEGVLVILAGVPMIGILYWWLGYVERRYGAGRAARLRVLLVDVVLWAAWIALLVWRWTE
jgi:hypothetical protein